MGHAAWAHARGTDDLRTRYKDARAEAHAADEALASAPPPDSSAVDGQVDARKALRIVEANKEGHDDALIEGVTGGKTQKQVGQELNLTHDQTRKATGKMRERHAGLLNKAGFVVGGVAIAVLIIFILMRSPPEFLRRDNVAAPYHPDTTEHAPPRKPPLRPEDVKTIRDLRAIGHKSAQAGDWQTCWTTYFAAEHMDESTPQDALEEASMCKEHLDKEKGTPR